MVRPTELGESEERIREKMRAMKSSTQNSKENCAHLLVWQQLM